MHPAEIKLVAEVDRDLTEMDRRVAALECALYGKVEPTWKMTWNEKGWLLGTDELIWIVDPVTKRPISKGYQNIVTFEDGFHEGLTIEDQWEEFFVHPAFKIEEEQDASS